MEVGIETRFDTQIIDRGDILERLDERLTTHPCPVTDEIRGLLETHPKRFNDSACVGGVMLSLDQFADQQATTIKNQTLASVYRDYPPAQPPLESPSQFMRKRGLDGTMRPTLRGAQEDAIRASRQRLVTDIEQDDQTAARDKGVDESDVRVSIDDYKTGLAQAVNTHVEKIETLMPELPAPVGWLGWIATYTVGRLRRRQPTVVVAPDNKSQQAQLEGEFFGLRSALVRLSQGETAAIETISKTHQPAVAAHLETEMGHHFAKLEAEELARLPNMLRVAYEKATHTGSLYEPSTEELKIIEEIEAQTPEPSDNGAAFEAGHAYNGSFEEVEIGEVDNPFEWVADKTIGLSVLSDGQQQLLVCKAMSPVTAEIRENLHDNHYLAKKLSNMWRRIQQIELAGQAITHGLIRSVKHADFHDLTIRYFTNSAAHTSRIYYAVSNAGRFPAIAGEAKRLRLGSDTPLLILLAETDKAHQLKVYTDFGIKCFKGVGSK